MDTGFLSGEGTQKGVFRLTSATYGIRESLSSSSGKIPAIVQREILFGRDYKLLQAGSLVLRSVLSRRRRCRSQWVAAITVKPSYDGVDLRTIQDFFFEQRLGNLVEKF